MEKRREYPLLKRCVPFFIQRYVDHKFVPNKKQFQFKLVPKIADPKSRVEIVPSELLACMLL